MNPKPDAAAIVTALREKGVLDPAASLHSKMDGTTEGRVYTDAVNDAAKYVVKIDEPESIARVELLHQAYSASPLLPKLIYTDPAKTFIVYAYTEGTTHHNRGRKIDWLTLLVKHFLNYYSLYPHADKWGDLDQPCASWHEFNKRNLAGARNLVGTLLPVQDYELVSSLLERISRVPGPYLLHGDTGVHNFVFRDSTLAGVIDPFPAAGPVSYDFTYAFCSSPDDLNTETLFGAFDLLQPAADRSILIEETVLQLYRRIGICTLYHPHDLEQYLQAWQYWKNQLA